MKKALIRILTFALVLILAASLGLPAFAAEINLGVTVTPGTDSITVVVDNSEDTNTVLAATPAMLEIACDFDTAYVTYDGKVVSGAELDTETGKITFPVAKGGTYTIRKGSVFQVTFHSNGGSTVNAQTIPSGAVITAPTTPTKAGFTFAGWYKEAALTNAWNFETDTVTANTTLYAKWTDAKTGSLVKTDAGSWNPTVDETTLDNAANALGDADDTVALRLTIKNLAAASVPKADQEAIEDLALGRALSWLDMKLECSINGGTYTNIGKTNDVLLKITLDFDATGKSNLAVFRYHDGKAQLLTAAAQGERFQLDPVNKKLIIYASKFSTYAVGYTTGNDTLDDYSFTKGHNSNWAKDSSRNLVFVCDGPYSLLSTMTINGQEIDLSYAESHEDGTQVTLKPAFLKNLPRGKYYLELHYKNGGYAIAAFQVTRATGNSSTGDQFNMTLWLSLLGISAAAVAVLVIVKKRKK